MDRRQRKRFTRAGLLAVFAGALVAGAAPGQDVTGPVGPPILQFSFSNPGARSMGFGGAFAALADDATAAFANPAGLVQITRSEVALEGRSWSYSTEFVERGRLWGDPTGIGVDTVPGLKSGTSSYDTTGLSFLSVVIPRKSWSIAFYRHLLADFEFFSQTRGFFAGSGDPCCRWVDYQTRTDLEIVSYALAGAYRVSDALSLGLSLVYFDASYRLGGGAFLPDADETLGIFAPTSFLPERLVGWTSGGTDDNALGLTAGFLWTISKRWRLGGFYRQGPTLEFSGETRSGEGGSYFGFPPAGTLLGSARLPVGLPDVYGLGGSFRPSAGRLTVSFEWARVEYSTFLESLGSDFDTSSLDQSDADELHLGAEYVFVRSKPVAAARLGVWLDPAHQPYFTDRATDIEQAMLPPGDDVMHYALGFGLAFESFQLDLAADLSSPVDAVSLSAIYSF